MCIKDIYQYMYVYNKYFKIFYLLFANNFKNQLFYVI